MPLSDVRSELRSAKTNRATMAVAWKAFGSQTNRATIQTSVCCRLRTKICGRLTSRPCLRPAHPLLESSSTSGSYTDEAASRSHHLLSSSYMKPPICVLVIEDQRAARGKCDCAVGRIRTVAIPYSLLLRYPPSSVPPAEHTFMT